MQNLAKKQIVILIVIVVILSILVAVNSNNTSNTPINEPNTEITQTREQPTAPTIKQTEHIPIQQKATAHSKPITNAGDGKSTEQQCVSHNTFNHDPRHRIVANYIKNEYLAGEIDYINYLNNDELEQLARNQNVKAMYILGINYQWNSIYEGDRSERFRPQEIEKQPIKARTAFNLQSFQKAQYWLEKAAFNGQISALIDIAVGYQQQAYMIEEKGEYSEKVIQNIKQNAIAYMQLHQQLAPELSQRTEIDSLIAQLGESDSARLALLQKRWKKAREDLGLSQHLELNLPPEIAQISKLRKQLCK